MQRSLNKKVGIAALIMMSSVFLSRLAGLLRESVIAGTCGAGGDVDAYQLAFLLPEFLNHVVATGFLSITFIPIFSQYLVRDMEEEGWRIFSLILTVFTPILVVLIAAASVWTNPLVGLVAHGTQDPSIKAMTVRMTRIVLPAQAFFFMGGLFMAVQFSKERFLFPALAPLIYNLGIIMGGLLLGPWLGIEGFAWGVLIGALVGNFFLQWIGARRVGMSFKPSLNISHPDLRRYLFLSIPLMIGLTMTFSTEFFFRFFGSYMPKGTVAALNYGLRVMLILVGLFGQAVGTASYPFMSRLVAEGRLDEMNQLLNRTLRYLSLVIPLSILFIVLRHEVIFIVFQRNQFDAAATEMTSHLLGFLLIGAFAFSTQTVVVRGFYAMQDMLFPAIFGTLAVLLSIPVYLLGIKWLGSVGVALGVSLSSIMQVTVLYELWNKRSRNQESRKVYRHVGKMILLSLFLGTALEGFKRFILSGIDPWTFQGAVFMSFALGLFFLVLLFLAGKTLRIEEIRDVLGEPMRRIRERRSK